MEKVIKFLSENPISTLATCSDNNPRSSTMEHMIINDNVIFATSPKSIKAKNIMANNKVSMTCHNMPLYLTIDGSVTPASADEISAYAEALIERHPEMKEMLEMMEKGMMEAWVYYRLVPQTVYYNDRSVGMTPPEIFNF